MIRVFGNIYRLPNGRARPSGQCFHAFHEPTADHYLLRQSIRQCRSKYITFDNRNLESLVIIGTYIIHVGNVHVFFSCVGIVHIISTTMIRQELVTPGNRLYLRQFFQLLHTAFPFHHLGARQVGIQSVPVFKSRVEIHQSVILQPYDRQQADKECGQRKLQAQQSQFPPPFVFRVTTIRISHRNTGVKITRHHSAKQNYSGRHCQTNPYSGQGEKRLQTMSYLFLQEILQAENNQYSKCQTNQSVQQRFRKNHPVNVATSCPIATIGGNSLGTAHHGRNNQQNIVQHSHQQHDNRKTQKDDVHDAVIIRRGKYFGYRTERELKTRTRLSHLFRHMIHFQHTLHAFLQVIRSSSFAQADIGLVAVIS